MRNHKIIENLFKKTMFLFMIHIEQFTVVVRSSTYSIPVFLIEVFFSWGLNKKMLYLLI